MIQAPTDKRTNNYLGNSPGKVQHGTTATIGRNPIRLAEPSSECLL